MFSHPIKEISAEFPAEEKHLGSIQQVAREACVTAGISRKDTNAILLAIEEAATNVIRHAYLYDPGMLRLRVVIFRKQIVFSLLDTGRPFHPDSRGQLDLERLVESGRRGGLGFYMIQKIMDQVEYFSTTEQNELRMTRHLRGGVRQGASSFFRRMFGLRVRFSLGTFLIVSIIVGGAFIFINERTESEVYSHLDGIVQALGSTISQQATVMKLNERSDVEFDDLVVTYHTTNPLLEQIVLVDTNGLIIAHSDDIRNIRKPYSPPSFIDAALYLEPQRRWRGNEEHNYLVFPMKSGERDLGKVFVRYSSAPIQEQLVAARESILKLTLILVGVGIIGIYLLSNYFVKPIVNITRRVRRFSSGDLETEMQIEGADEFSEISSALNQMMTRLRRDRDSALERERMTKEIEVASQIQKTLLPGTLPQMSGLELEAYYRAASMIGGDLYDVFKVGEDRCGIVVADVSGKGVPASLVMSMLRTVIQIYSQEAQSSRTVMKMVSQYLSDNIPPGMFITVLLGIYDATDRVLNFVSAGHNPLLVYRSSLRQVSKMNPSGMPLGVPIETMYEQSEEMFEQAELELQVGDVFFAYTDGITEAVDRAGRQYGIERLAQFLRDKLAENDVSLGELSAMLVDEIDNFSGVTHQKDDMTFVLGRPIDRADGLKRKAAEASLDLETKSVPSQTEQVT